MTDWLDEQSVDFQLDVLFAYGKLDPTKDETLDVWEKTTEGLEVSKNA